MTIIYRQAKPGDETAIASHHNMIVKGQYEDVYGKDATDAWASHKPEKWLKQIGSDRYSFYLAFDGSALVGAAGLDIENKRLGVYVAQSHQRQGIARRLMQTQLDEAKRHGIMRLDLAAPKSAVPFYQSLGYSIIHPKIHTFSNGAEIQLFDMKIDLA